MSDLPDSKPVDLAGFVNFLETVVADPAQKGTKAAKAAGAFLAFLGSHAYETGADPETILLDWMISLRLRDIAYSTAFSYLKAVSGLHSRAAGQSAAPTDAFTRVKTRMRSLQTLWSEGLTRADFDRFLSLTKSLAAKDTDVAVEADIVLMSLLTGARPVMETAYIKKTEIFDADEAIIRIAQRQLFDSARLYLFSLNQGKTTPRKFLRQLTADLADFFSRAQLRWTGGADQTVQSYWAYAALLTGVPPRDVAAALGKVPEGFPLLSVYDVEQADAAARARIAEDVRRIFTANPPRWYAMHLRRRATFAELTKKIDRLPSPLRRPELFYPCEELSRRAGKKIVFRERPIIRDIVFFQSRATDIAPIFYHIGDLAWCLTTAGKGSPYAAISDRSFRRFQTAIGRFTGEAVAGATLSPGDEVLIIGGPCADSKGKVLKINPDTPEGLLTYLISVVNDLTDKFTATVDSRQLRPLPATR